MNELAGKVAVVTGASKGIGAGIARRFGAAGASVVVNYASDRAGADRVVADITRQGGKAIAAQANVSQRAEVQLLFAAAREAFGTIDVLVNNAGIYEFNPLEQFTEAEYRRQFDTNVLGLLIATHESLQHFGPHGGSIINVSSIVGTNPVAGAAVYSATKAAVESITLSSAIEFAPRKIRVNAIAPGLTHSEGVERLGIAGSDFEKDIVSRTPLGRHGEAKDIADVALLLASDLAGWVTGESLRAAGGLR